jgi:hypothetical protein
VLKREITYEDFNGEKNTDTFYFNITKFEILDLEASYEGGLEATIGKYVKDQNIKGLLDAFRKVILFAYGERSEDGKRFIKNDKIREEFSQTAAYDELLTELATDPDKADVFIKGIIPKDVASEINKAQSVPLPPAPRN